MPATEHRKPFPQGARASAVFLAAVVAAQILLGTAVFLTAYASMDPAADGPALVRLGVSLLAATVILGIATFLLGRRLLVAPLVREAEERKQIMSLLEYNSAQVKEKEQFLRDVIEDQTELICRFTAEGKLSFANSAFLRYAAFSSEDASDARFPLAEDKAVRELIHRSQDGTGQAESKTLTRSMPNAGGDEYWIQWQIRSLPKGEFQAVGHDVTQTRNLRLTLEQYNRELEQRVLDRTREFMTKNEELALEVRERIKAEEVARDNEYLLSSILDGINAAYIIMNTDTDTVISMNRAAERMFDLKTEDVIYENCRTAFEKRFGETCRVVCDSGAEQTEGRESYLAMPSGSRLPVYKFTFSVGQDRRAVILFDQTERKNLERRLGVAQKMESIGLLASGIAHEINTPIQFTGDSVRFMQEAFEDLAGLIQAYKAVLEQAEKGGDTGAAAKAAAELEEEADLEFIIQEIPRACARALDGTARVATIVQAMKNFAHPGMEEKKPVNLKKALENTVTIARNEWKYVADVALDIPGDLPMVECLPGDMNQVFLNILVNAAHAIKDVIGESGRKGAITISGEHRGQEVVIRIEDTGTGIPKENITRIFDPFFTTKEVGKGTGQGLAIVHDIVVNKHGGSIDVDSAPGRGTAFILTLPTASDRQGAP